jgi:tetratricopeptide (TPR) repeat protein
MLNGELMMGLSKLYTSRAIDLKNNGDMVNARAYYDSSVYCLQEAKGNFLRAIEITPNMGSAINNLAVIYFNEDSVAQAKKYINMALKGTPNMAAGDVAVNANDRAKLNHNLGILFFKEHKIDSALLQFELSIYYDSTFGEAYFDMSDVLLMNHDTTDAIKILLRAARNLPDKGTAYTDLANVSLYRNDTTSAVKYCEMAAQNHMVNPQVIMFLRNYFSMKNDMQKSKYYEQLLQQIISDRGKAPTPER